jgi:hypothetical protein
MNASKVLAEQKARIAAVPPAVKYDGISAPAPPSLKTHTQVNIKIITTVIPYIM